MIIFNNITGLQHDLFSICREDLENQQNYDDIQDQGALKRSSKRRKSQKKTYQYYTQNNIQDEDLIGQPKAAEESNLQMPPNYQTTPFSFNLHNTQQQPQQKQQIIESLSNIQEQHNDLVSAQQIHYQPYVLATKKNELENNQNQQNQQQNINIPIDLQTQNNALPGTTNQKIDNIITLEEGLQQDQHQKQQHEDQENIQIQFQDPQQKDQEVSQNQYQGQQQEDQEDLQYQRDLMNQSIISRKSQSSIRENMRNPTYIMRKNKKRKKQQRQNENPLVYIQKVDSFTQNQPPAPKKPSIWQKLFGPCVNFFKNKLGIKTEEIIIQNDNMLQRIRNKYGLNFLEILTGEFPRALNFEPHVRFETLIKNVTNSNFPSPDLGSDAKIFEFCTEFILLMYDQQIKERSIAEYMVIFFFTSKSKVFLDLLKDTKKQQINQQIAQEQSKKAIQVINKNKNLFQDMDVNLRQSIRQSVATGQKYTKQLQDSEIYKGILQDIIKAQSKYHFIEVFTKDLCHKFYIYLKLMTIFSYKIPNNLPFGEPINDFQISDQVWKMFASKYKSDSDMFILAQCFIFEQEAYYNQHYIIAQSNKESYFGLLLLLVSETNRLQILNMWKKAYQTNHPIQQKDNEDQHDHPTQSKDNKTIIFDFCETISMVLYALPEENSLQGQYKQNDTIIINSEPYSNVILNQLKKELLKFIPLKFATSTAYYHDVLKQQYESKKINGPYLKTQSASIIQTPTHHKTSSTQLQKQPQFFQFKPESIQKKQEQVNSIGQLNRNTLLNYKFNEQVLQNDQLKQFGFQEKEEGPNLSNKPLSQSVLRQSQNMFQYQSTAQQQYKPFKLSINQLNNKPPTKQEFPNSDEDN